jgi:hypothetical protein
MVDATGKLFQTSENGRRTPLQTLEYLVSSLAVFTTREPRDAIFSLLAVARDTMPVAVAAEDPLSTRQPDARKTLIQWASDKQRNPYSVDYNLSLVQVYRDFVEFAIRQSSITEPNRALDIL